ncbi:SDR family NAD(P)-dependent oxidoreductase [Aquirufa salirivi]|uniref:Glucose 1-dehydrogenase n=1 Tax=Aquirufa salirivi TaxID=3104729 RepID=A0ABW8RQA9_9BACT
MNKDLTNKVAIVTGASKGIGVGIAKQLSTAGAKVIVNYASSKADAERVVGEITANGGTAMAIQADVSKATDVKRLFEETNNAFGNIDILVNNAGVFEVASYEASTEDAFHRMFNINVLGTLIASQEAVKHFEGKGGSIINISSVVSKNPEPFVSLYSASKAAVSMLTKASSQELGPKNIRVNSILPGTIHTEGLINLGIEKDSDMLKGLVARVALGRLAKPTDVGDLVVFLSSDEATMITGQEIDISGGMR